MKEKVDERGEWLVEEGKVGGSQVGIQGRDKWWARVHCTNMAE